MISSVVFIEKSNAQTALDFDGADDFITGSDVGFPSGASSRTIEAWVKTSGVATYGSILEFGTNSTGQESSLGVQTSGFIYFWGSSLDLMGTINITDGNWHHIAATYNGVTLKLYVDGILDVSANMALSTVLDGSFDIGKSAWMYTGMIDDVRLWDYEKSVVEINAEMSTCLSGAETGLVALYDFENGTASSVLTDLAGGDNNGVLTNMDPATDWVSGVSCTPPAPPCIVNQTVSTAQSSFMCEGSTTIDVASSEVGVNYYLRDDADDSIIAGPIAGTGSAIVFNTGTILATTTYNVYATSPSSGPSTALDFDGVDDNVIASTGTDVLSGNYTFETWIQPNHPTDLLNVFNTRGTANYSFDVKIWGGNSIGAAIGNGTSWITSTGATFNYNVGQWYHIAYTVSNSGYTIYIDGIEVGSGVFSGTPLLFDSTHPISIGKYFSEQFNGAIDEVKIWNTIRTLPEISTSMNTCLTGSEPGLVAYYNFEDGAGSSIVTDLTGNYNGTLINMDSASDWVDGAAVCGTCNLEMAVTPTVTVNSIIDQGVSAVQSSFVCSGSTTIDLASSETGINYFLRNDTDDSVIAGPIAGTGSTISLNTGAVSATTTYNVYASTPSASLDFDGIDDEVNCGSGINIANSSFTLECWAKRDAVGTLHHFFSLGTNATNQGLHCRMNPDGTVRFAFWGADYDAPAGPYSTDGLWHHYSFTYNVNTNLKSVYVDGSLIGTNNSSGDFVGTGDFLIGDIITDYGTPFPWDGQIDEVRVWNLVRSQSEVSSNMNSCLNGNEPGLVGYYTFDETGDGAGSSVVYDKAGGDNNGTLTNMDSATDWVTGQGTCGSCSFEMTVTPAVTINSVDASTSTIGDVISAVNSSATSYQWVDCNNANAPIASETNQSFTATAVGNYAVEVTQNGCMVTSPCVNIATLGISDDVFGAGIKLYPNPTTGNVTLSFNENIAETTFTIFDVIGKEVYVSQKVNEKSVLLNINHFSSGVYFVQIQNDKSQKVIRLIKE